jgi:saccharopine dehydrogenase-like NADP-dependent oxidoreductase
VLVLGGGMIGSAVAFDLVKAGVPVMVADTRPQALAAAKAAGAEAVICDVSDAAAVRPLLAGHDLVVGALPSALGFAFLANVIAAGKDAVDISFMAEDALALDGEARRAGSTIVVDCGVAPGVSNLMVGYAASRLDAVETVEIYVGGLPRERRWPFDYKAGFAPFDVIEEYVRPARLVENGRVVVREALSEPELMDFPGLGTLEAFNTDGLRTLVQTIDAPFMKEKTLRYPGHVHLMRAFRETGLFSKDPVDVRGKQIRPLDATAALLFPKWTFEEGEEDITVLRVVVTGREDGRAARYAWDLIDRYDPVTRLRSMSRTTAYPAAAVARRLLAGAFTTPGVHPPETLGGVEGFTDAVLEDLKARGIRIAANPGQPAAALTA